LGTAWASKSRIFTSGCAIDTVNPDSADLIAGLDLETIRDVLAQDIAGAG
jgi:hypothetical protein